MLNLIFAVVAATAQPAATAPQTVAEPAPHVRRSEEVVCKMMMWDGIGAAQRVCATRADWEERSARQRQALMEFQQRSYTKNR